MNTNNFVILGQQKVSFDCICSLFPCQLEGGQGIFGGFEGGTSVRYDQGFRPTCVAKEKGPDDRKNRRSHVYKELSMFKSSDKASNETWPLDWDPWRTSMSSLFPVFLQSSSSSVSFRSEGISMEEDCLEINRKPKKKKAKPLSE